MKQSKAVKIILGIWVAVIGVIVLLLGALFVALPSPQKLAGLIAGSKSAPATAKATLAEPTPSAEPLREPKPAEPNPKQTAESQEAKTETTAKPGNRLIEERYLDQTANVSPAEICGSLGSDSAPITSAEDFAEQLGKLENKEIASSPSVEAVLLPVGFLLKMPSIQEVVEEARVAKERGESSLLKKATFYAKVATAVTEVYSRSDELNRVADAGYYLYVLSKLTDKAPGLRSSNELFSLCEEMIAAPPANESEQKELASTVSKLIHESGFSDRDVGFNPEYRTKVDVKTSDNSIRVGMGWMEEVLKMKSQSKANN